MKYHVTYRDGGTADYDVLPIHLVDYEENVGPLGQAETASASFRLAHIASEADVPFKDWLRTVREINVTGVEPGEPGEDEADSEPVPTS